MSYGVRWALAASRALLLYALAYAPAWAQVREGRVVAVADGATLEVVTGAQRQVVALAGIRAPQGSERRAIASRQSLIALCGSDPVRLTIRERRADGVLTAQVQCHGADAGGEQVRRGMAVVMPGVTDRGLQRLEGEARAARRGLWAGTSDEP